MERFIIQQSENAGKYVCTDQKNQIVCVFEAHKFNDTQKFSLLENKGFSPIELAKAAREMGDWLRENHYNKIF
jgi:hypothetical protein